MKATFLNALFIAGITLLGTSCNKVSNITGGGGGLTAGQCTFSFNTDKDFNGTKSINIPASATSSATKTDNLNTTQITLIANNFSVGSGKIASAQMTISVPKGSTTSGGNISVPFSGSSTQTATLIVSNLTAGQSKPAYAAETGTVVITKLTATDVEGTFSCYAVNDDDKTSINLSNGKFAGKFK